MNIHKYFNNINKYKIMGPFLISYEHLTYKCAFFYNKITNCAFKKH